MTRKIKRKKRDLLSFSGKICVFCPAKTEQMTGAGENGRKERKSGGKPEPREEKAPCLGKNSGDARKKGKIAPATAGKSARTDNFF